ncbi:hypothetical protein [Paenibacillus piscarius]|uniref:hypothetical protein n=1 Tax=Paenibacillus piscarius TaxID=1089681 RepID=UPI001EE81B33|nr:hypothetical protein [Paenibacillus piscarius]
MLKLLKYDLRRRRERILVFSAIAILIQPALWISNPRVDMKLLTLNLTVYMVLAVAFLLVAAFSYIRNLRSYQRRLLPVSALQTVLSPLLLALFLLVIVVALIVIHLGIYRLFDPLEFLPDDLWSAGVSMAVQFTWSAGIMMIMSMFSITAALSLHSKWRIWIGVAILFILQNGVAFVENTMFDIYFVGVDRTFNFEMYNYQMRPDSGLTIRYMSDNPGPLLFETAIACLLVYGMVQMVKQRIEL